MEKSNKILSWFLFCIILTVAGCQHSDQHFITVKNPLNKKRADAQLTISRDSLDTYLPNIIDSAFIIKDKNGENIAYQLDDLDGDSSWDELAMLCSFKKGEKKKLYFTRTSKEDLPEFTDRANIWFARLDSSTQKYQPVTHEVRPSWYHRIMETPFYYQFEGPGWENDHIGFRMYFDQRNGFDIWGKKTSNMVLKDVGLHGDNYHELSSWGMDVLHVGNTLGAGAIAAIKNDSLYKLGATDKTTFQQVTDGPVRAVFDIKYEGWHLGGENYAVKERISIWGGQQGYTNKVSLLNGQKLTLVTGIVTAKLPGKPVFNDSTPFPYVTGWGRQSEHKDYLGMAVTGTPEGYISHGQRHLNPSSVDSSAFLKYNLTPSKPVKYRFVAGSEIGNKKFRKKSYFMNTVRQEGVRLNNPVQVIYP